MKCDVITNYLMFEETHAGTPHVAHPASDSEDSPACRKKASLLNAKPARLDAPVEETEEVL